MKRTRWILVLLLSAVLLLTLTACGEPEPEVSVSVTLVNRSGCDISSISITPSTSTEWDTEYVDGVFADGESIEAGLGTYKESEVPDTYNILVYNGENYILYDTSVDELDIELHDGDYIVFLPPEGEVPFDVVSDYDPSAYDTEDEWIEEPDYMIDETADIAPYAGCWKFDTEPFYIVINEDYEWIAINLYGQQVGPGHVVMEEGGVSLYQEDGSFLATLTQAADGSLSDENGNALSSWDYIMLLPTPEDELNQTASFPGGFTNVTIDYPIQMEAHEQSSVSNSLSFNAVMEDGTDDYYSNILVAFQPISGFDDYMSQGAATAKAYMVKMLDDFMNSMYGSYLLKSFGSNFQDNGDNYSLTGYMWLDGSIFANGPDHPVRGCMEVRYYGPTGYALVAVTIAEEARIRKYNVMPTLRRLQRCDIDTGHFYVQVTDYLSEVTKALIHITRPAFEHIDNNHEGMSKEQIVDLMRVNDQVEAIFDKINDMLATKDFSDLDLVLEMRDKLFDTIVEAIKSQLRRINDVPSGSTRAGVLYLTILNETKTMMLQSRNLLKSQQYFLEAKK